MEDQLTRFVADMSARVDGPMSLRLVLQPVMAAVFAIRAGLGDAKAGKPAYFWALFTQPEHRADMLKDGWKSIGKVFIIAMVLDVIYQVIVQRWVYPVEVVWVAFLLAILPYLVLRGVTNRLASKTQMARTETPAETDQAIPAEKEISIPEAEKTEI